MESYKKDFTHQILLKLNKLSCVKDKQEFSSDMNDFINLMNYSFLMKNNFFIDNFNQKVIRIIYPAYNKIKTNIINTSCNYLFDTLTNQQLKSIRFIIVNGINIYDLETSLDNNDNNISNNKCLPITSLISKNSLYHCLTAINEALRLLEQK